MLPAFRNHVHVMLGPTHVLVSRTASGWRPQKQVSVAHTQAPAAGAPKWISALTKMGEEIQLTGSRRGVCDVTLSDCFVRYATLPWHDALRDRSEAEAFASARMHEIYGAAAVHWKIWLDKITRGSPSLISAIDLALLQGLREKCALSGLILRSVTPFLSATFDRCRGEVKDQDFWFAANDGIRLSAGLFRTGKWTSVFCEPVDDDVTESLRRALAQDPLLETHAAHTYLWQAGDACTACVQVDGKPVIQLAPGCMDDAARFAGAQAGITA